MSARYVCDGCGKDAPDVFFPKNDEHAPDCLFSAALARAEALEEVVEAAREVVSRSKADTNEIVLAESLREDIEMLRAKLAALDWGGE